MGGVRAMTIEQLDDKRIIISLGNQELEQYAVTFESLNTTEKHSRALLKELLQKVSRQTGICLQNKRVMIEALQYAHGCLLLLTVTDKKRRLWRIRYHRQTEVFSFSELNCLLDCIKALYRMQPGKLDSAVYRCGTVYYLVLTASPAAAAKCRHTAGEFCRSRTCGRGFRAFLEEHGRVIVPKQALETIGSKL